MSVEPTDANEHTKSETPFDVFLSYSHDPDYDLSRHLEAFLESFHTIPTLRPTVLKPLSVCRDGSDFSLPDLKAAGVSAATAVHAAIERQLTTSANLLVLCSESSARSPWVRFEVEWFLANRGAERIRLAMTEGVNPGANPGHYLCEPLQKAGFETQIWYDLRGFSMTRCRKWKKVPSFEDECIQIACHFNGSTLGQVRPLYFAEQQAREQRQSELTKKMELAVSADRSLRLTLGAREILSDPRIEDKQAALVLAIHAVASVWNVAGASSLEAEATLREAARLTSYVKHDEPEHVGRIAQAHLHGMLRRSLRFNVDRSLLLRQSVSYVELLETSSSRTLFSKKINDEFQPKAWNCAFDRLAFLARDPASGRYETGQVSILDALRNQVLLTIPDFCAGWGYVGEVRWSPDAHYLAGWGTEKPPSEGYGRERATTKVWDAATGKLVRTFRYAFVDWTSYGMVIPCEQPRALLIWSGPGQSTRQTIDIDLAGVQEDAMWIVQAGPRYLALMQSHNGVMEGGGGFLARQGWPLHMGPACQEHGGYVTAA